MITITPVTTRKQKKHFINVPKYLYKDDPNWIAPLDIEVAKQIDPKKNPLIKELTLQLWVAYKNNLPVGRISAQINPTHHQYHHPTEGHFGFLEADSYETMQALLDTAESWLKSHQMTKMTGPFTLSINEESGMLVEGFNTPNYFFMGHHKPQYLDWMTTLKFSKEKDLLAFTLDLTQPFSKRWHQIIARSKSHTITVKTLNAAHYDTETEQALHLFNNAWQHNWGFLPFTQDGINHIKKNFKFILNPDYFALASYKNRLTGIFVAIPNLNEIIHKMNGSLLPWGWLKLLLRLKCHRYQTLRVIFAGIHSDIQQSPIGAAVIALCVDKIAQIARNNGIKQVETSWVLEDNTKLIKILKILGLTVYKRYRLFSKSI